MTTPENVTAAPEGRPADWPAIAAAAVSTLLAIPGISAAAGLLYLLAVIVSFGVPSSGEDILFVGGVLLALVFPPVGLYLLAGYWRAARRHAPSAQPRRFWWLSAGFNAVGAAATVIAAFGGAFDRSGLLVTPVGLAWMGFMIWLGTTRAAAAGGGPAE